MMVDITEKYSMRRFFIHIVSIITRILPNGIKKRLYRLGPLSNGIRMILNRISPVGLSEVTIAAGAIKGMRMELDMQSEKDYWLGTYELELQHGIEQKVQSGWIAYDVGANIGFFSLLFGKTVGENGKVFSFEPLPTNLERLHKNLYLNNLQTSVVVLPYAVVDETKEIKFLIGSSGAMGKAAGSGGREDTSLYHDAIYVPGISLDDFVYKEKNPLPKVIKMDIEGGEVLALEGMTHLLKEARPLIFLELHGPTAAKVAWNSLNKEGYRFCEMSAGLPPITSVEQINWKSYLVALP